MKQTKRRQAGFSLIEILVVLVIIGLLAGIVAPNLIGEVGRAEKKRVETDFRSIETALKIYRLDNFTYQRAGPGGAGGAAHTRSGAAQLAPLPGRGAARPLGPPLPVFEPG